MMEAQNNVAADTASRTDWVRFAHDLTELCGKHGIGIEGGVAYQMEGDDYLFSYQIADSGRIARG